LRVAGAPAQVAGERLADVLARRRRPLRQQRLRRQEHARRAIAALRGAELGKGLLEGMEAATVSHPLDRRDPATFEVGGKREARQHGEAVDEDGARSALAELAAVLRPGESEALAQDLEERLGGGAEHLMGLVAHR